LKRKDDYYTIVTNLEERLESREFRLGSYEEEKNFLFGCDELLHIAKNIAPEGYHPLFIRDMMQDFGITETDVTMQTETDL